MDFLLLLFILITDSTKLFLSPNFKIKSGYSSNSLSFINLKEEDRFLKLIILELFTNTLLFL
ncbi:hypothetical protein, partial [Clostridioides difficile]|uniref:hypothetical protein n=1 Tax=Clostridioides difficile TaxID=1496 RepID=UPI001A9AFA9D